MQGLVTKRSGSAAFIYDPYEGTRQLCVTSATGDKIVDQGADIVPTSLDLSGDHRSVTYLKAGERRTAPIS